MGTGLTDRSQPVQTEVVDAFHSRYCGTTRIPRRLTPKTATQSSQHLMKNNPPKYMSIPSTPTAAAVPVPGHCEPERHPAAFTARVQIADALMCQLERGHPLERSDPRMNSLCRAFVRALADRALESTERGRFGGPMRFDVWGNEHLLPVVATASRDDEHLVILDVAYCASN